MTGKSALYLTCALILGVANGCQNSHSSSEANSTAPVYEGFKKCVYQSEDVPEMAYRFSVPEEFTEDRPGSESFTNRDGEGLTVLAVFRSTPEQYALLNEVWNHASTLPSAKRFDNGTGFVDIKDLAVRNAGARLPFQSVTVMIKKDDSIVSVSMGGALDGLKKKRSAEELRTMADTLKKVALTVRKLEN